MADHVCPYLGAQEDREIVYEFPADQNTCYKANPARPVDLDYQRKFCLGANHQACPVFLAKQPVSLPSTAAAPATRRLPTRALILAGALVAILLVGVGIYAGLASMQPSTALIPVTGGSPTPTDSLEGTSPVERLLDSTGTYEATLAGPSCPLPDGWITYTAVPTDSFSLLSRLYNVSAAELRTANCLDSDAVLHPGEIIFVPMVFEPTDIPPTVTPTVRVVQANPIVIPPAAPSSNESNPPAPTAVVVQPSATSAPTNVPPTETLELPSATATEQPPEPTEPQPEHPPSSGAIVVTDSDITQTINCDGANVTVQGSNNNLTLLGTCARLTVTGNGNIIDLENWISVNDNGNDNKIQ